MARRSRVVHFSRLRVPTLVQALDKKASSDWPDHLRLAYDLIHNELGVPPLTARRVVFDSVSHAHACAQAVNRRTQFMAEYELRLKVRKSFDRLGKCATRAPATDRNSLDKAIAGVIAQNFESDEVIDQILDSTYAVCAQRSEHEFAQTALRALAGKDLNGKPIVVLKTDYSGLSPVSHRRCERAVSSLSAPKTASAVFQALTRAIDTHPPDSTRSDIGDLIVTYVAAVVTIWRGIGLSPSRVNRRSNPNYRGKFHRFVELVLTAVMEPFSNRHSRNLDQIACAKRNAHKTLRPEIRPIVSQALPRIDVEWLVSDHHVREAISATTQKIGYKTP